jgi:3-oxoacyl-[acyl-carrier-protein] synthase-3
MPATNGSVIIRGTGSCLPEKVLTNLDLSKIVDTSDEWIQTRTGICQRRISGEGQSTSDLAVEAGRKALEDAGIDKGDIDLLIVATITPDVPFPSTACLVQAKLGLGKITAFDLEAACSGFLYILDTATAMLQSGRYKNALIIGAEKMSSVMDWEDRKTCVLFGDGAGAAVLTWVEESGYGLVDSTLHADGSHEELLHMPGGGSRTPASSKSLEDRQHFLRMKGKEIFKHAVRNMCKAAQTLLDRQGLDIAQVDRVIPHQANIRIIDTIQERLDIPKDKLYNNLEFYGNTSAASIPIALDEACRKGFVRHGDLVLCIAFGAGLTWGASLIKWYKSF